MKYHTIICVEIEYDDEQATPEALADRLSQFNAAFSLPGAAINRTVALELGTRLLLSDECAAGGDLNSQELAVEIARTPYGVDIAALNVFQERLATVALDYFDNRVRLLGWANLDDDPECDQVLCPDVRKAMCRRLEPDCSSSAERIEAAGG